MRAVRTGALRAGALIGAACIGIVAAVNAVNCASATTITLEVRGNPDICSQINDTGIAVASKNDIEDPNKAGLEVFQPDCKEGKIGTLVITPRSSSSADRTARIAIRVVAGLNGKGAYECDKLGEVGENCIRTTREVAFVQGSDVPLVVTLSGKCVRVSCDPGETCDPEATGEDLCVPIEDVKPTPTTSSSSGNVVPDGSSSSGNVVDAGKDAAAPTPEELCLAKNNGSFFEGGCTFSCSGTACHNQNICPPGLRCTILCVGPDACVNVQCSSTAQCVFDCLGGTCKNISCDAGSCEAKCGNNEKSCEQVTFVGSENKLGCARVDTTKPSCDDVKCVPGPVPNTTTCARTCGPDAGGCGKKYECDAGNCAQFEGP